jgi:hypothetical protein
MKEEKGMTMSWVTVTDENGNDFPGLTQHPSPEAEKKVPVWAFIHGKNGFGKNDGEVAMLMLKRLGDGKFGA